MKLFYEWNIKVKHCKDLNHQIIVDKKKLLSHELYLEVFSIFITKGVKLILIIK